ncbi:pyridoxamine 5'-phosphate oxidase family protein [Martelella sp. AMO21009]
MKTAFSDTIDVFLLGHHVMSVALCDSNGPWAASVFYVTDLDRRRLMFFTSETTRHGAALLANGKMAATVAGQERDVGKLCGLQIEGDAAMLKKAEAQKGIALFRTAFPEITDNKATLWAFRPNLIKLTDNTKGFGHKEVWQAGRDN